MAPYKVDVMAPASEGGGRRPSKFMASLGYMNLVSKTRQKETMERGLPVGRNSIYYL